MDLFISPERQQLLEANQLGTPGEVWGLQAEWFEAPNIRRGGWSGVCRLGVPLPEGGELGLFLKRQENHQRFCWRHPVRGEPTFVREFRMLRYLQLHGVPAPLPVFFASTVTDGNSRGMLMTEELSGYRPLDVVVRELFADGPPPVKVQRRLLRTVAQVVRRLHSVGVQHSALYPKHLFVRMHDDADPEVALIDLESARVTYLSRLRTVRDLDSLNRRSRYWSRSARLYFLLQYLGLDKLDDQARRLCRRLLRHAGRAGKS